MNKCEMCLKETKNFIVIDELYGNIYLCDKHIGGENE